MTHRYLRLRALLDGNPVLSVGAQVHFVGADVVVLPGFFGDGALRPDGCDESEEPQVHLEAQAITKRVQWRTAGSGSAL